MTLSAGTVEYTIGTAPVTGCGISWTAEELDTALAGPVAEVVFDDAGNADCAAILEGLSETEFDREGVQRVLNSEQEPEAWRVGEGLAESYLTHHRNCSFPWPDGRDERKSGSSLPGADLVGFHHDGEQDCFAFGEVKTSGEAKHPPGAMYGRTGLKQQLEDLRDKVSIRDDLVKYLWHRAVNASWKGRFINAYKRYNADSADVCLFGLLVRDVEPHRDDLRVRVTKLGKGCPSVMSIELIAIYLPAGSIDSLSEKVVQSRKGGDT
ncbi:MAG: hypothetical protein DRH10_07970 [Deltaproteobacteria bacterium]|nr:MAG: hypothetical protein DRH10_07970 [Deltaproteobacteria bacterium]